MNPTPITADRELRRAARIERLRRDFQQFAELQLRIRHSSGGKIAPFVLNKPQQKIEATVQRQLKEHGWIRICLLKARQFGASTWSAARGFHAAVLNPNVHTHIIAQDKETTSHIFEMDRLFFDDLDETIKPMHRYSSKLQLVFENPDEATRGRNPGLRSMITFQTAGRKNPGTGQTIQFLHLSEVSKYVNTEFLDTSIFPTVHSSPGTAIIMESTAHPMGDWFHQQCELAYSGKTDMEFIFIPWFDFPEYALKLTKGEQLKLDHEERFLAKKYGVTMEQLKWRRLMIQKFGGDKMADQKFETEYPKDRESAWQSFEYQVFDPQRLFNLGRAIMPPKTIYRVIPGPIADRRQYAMVLDNSPSDTLWVWKEPEPGEQYDLGVDVAMGTDEGDFSVIQVIKRRTREQVAEWHGRGLPPLMFAETVMAVGYYYNTGQIGCEIEGIGFAVNDAIVSANYDYVYIWRQRGRSVPTLSTFSGWKSQTDSKSMMIARMKQDLNDNQLVFHSRRLMQEMKQFSVFQGAVGEVFRAAPGAHDDLVMAYGIAIMIAFDESFGAAVETDGDEQREPTQIEDRMVASMREQGITVDNSARPVGYSNPLDRLVEELKAWR